MFSEAGMEQDHDGFHVVQGKFWSMRISNFKAPNRLYSIINLYFTLSPI